MYRYTTKQLFDFIIPSIFLIGLVFLFHQTSLNEQLAGHFFTPSAEWIYRDNFFLERILHKGGVLLSLAIILGIIGRLVFIWKKPVKKQETDYWGFVLASTLLTIVLIAILKMLTTLPCPWSSATFGGPVHTPPLWKMFATDFPKMHCFPAGHSSGGFAFLSMYFGYTLVYGKRNFWTLCPGIIMGLVYGMTQEM